MRIVVCAKQVLDPDAVNNYALEGRLEIGDDGKSLTQASIPRLMNAYDEQAIEAALKMRDAGQDVTLVVVCVGPESIDPLKHAASLGADEIVQIDVDPTSIDYHSVARILAAYVEKTGGADLILCGRQASDDDQGVVPGILSEHLDRPLITIARSVDVADGSVKVIRVTPDGDETVEATLPAIVTVSNEIGEPRYPTMQAKMKSRKRKPEVMTLDDLGVSAADVAPRVALTKQFVPTVKGDCEMIDGGSAAELADRLVARLREESAL